MRNQVSKDLYAYWDTLRGDRPAPDRADIDLLAIREILADTFIIEHAPDGAFPLRISGTRVDALWGGDRKGVCFTELWRVVERFSVAGALAGVVEEVMPVVASARIQAPGDAHLDLELLLLPLQNFRRGHTRIIGALTPLYPVDWRGLGPTGPLEMVSMRWCGDAGLHLRHRAAQKQPRLIVYDGGKL